MPRAPSAFRQSDLAKAIKAAIAAGLRVTKINFKTGELVTADNSAVGAENSAGTNEWDEGLRHDKSST
jgi:hypothetical protein